MNETVALQPCRFRKAPNENGLPTVWPSHKLLYLVSEAGLILKIPGMVWARIVKVLPMRLSGQIEEVQVCSRSLRGMSKLDGIQKPKYSAVC